jgi:hypothetical protein
MALRWVLWNDDWPTGTKKWEFVSVAHQELRKRGYAPDEDTARQLLRLPNTNIDGATFERWWSNTEQRACWVSDSYESLGETSTRTAAYAAFCSKCRYSMDPLPVMAQELFETGSVRCRHCSAENDLWTGTVAQAAEWDGRLLRLHALGAFETTARVEMRPGDTKEVRLAVYGIPLNALLVDVRFMAIGTGVHPLFIHGNDVFDRTVTEALWIYGRPMGEPEPDPIDVQVELTWVLNDNDAEPWTQIADALEAFRRRRLARTIISIQTAFEVALSRLIRHSHSIRQTSAAGARLNAARAFQQELPRIADAAGVRQLPAPITATLDLLRNRRNAVVHEALRDDEISGRETAELLIGGVFGFEYLRYIRRVISVPASSSA